MIGRTNALAVGGVSANGMPQITFNGKWLPWHVEFYDGVPYWEAWFLSSGTLKVTGTYTADAWGIGGGGSGAWGTSASSGSGYAGCADTRLNITLTGNMAVTIGAGAVATDFSSYGARGGDTKLGDVIQCFGGYYSGDTGSGTYKRYRFGASDKEAEAAGGTAWNDINGWLNIVPNTAISNRTASVGVGIGAGAGQYGLAKSGALVIRIPM